MVCVPCSRVASGAWHPFDTMPLWGASQHISTSRALGCLCVFVRRRRQVGALVAWRARLARRRALLVVLALSAPLALAFEWRRWRRALRSCKRAERSDARKSTLERRTRRLLSRWRQEARVLRPLRSLMARLAHRRMAGATARGVQLWRAYAAARKRLSRELWSLRQLSACAADEIGASRSLMHAWELQQWRATDELAAALSPRDGIGTAARAPAETARRAACLDALNKRYGTNHPRPNGAAAEQQRGRTVPASFTRDPTMITVSGASSHAKCDPLGVAPSNNPFAVGRRASTTNPFALRPCAAQRTEPVGDEQLPWWASPGGVDLGGLRFV
jgi:hypothetical protein